ncbi:hypothetical protein QQZ08_000327 [Neonectria magnoliae]|uniref:CHCH domain-containing protein n=1 Tax=Neonectria magnoliae TaxID=2732573 RepID=A0ABR1IKM9_9HYPO
MTPRLAGDDSKELKQDIRHCDETGKNNYECVKYKIDAMRDCQVGLNSMPPEECEIKELSIPSRKDPNLENPLQYPKC